MLVKIGCIDLPIENLSPAFGGRITILIGESGKYAMYDIFILVMSTVLIILIH
jgi:hypothetical protein